MYYTEYESHRNAFLFEGKKPVIQSELSRSPNCRPRTEPAKYVRVYVPKELLLVKDATPRSVTVPPTHYEYQENIKTRTLEFYFEQWFNEIRELYVTPTLGESDAPDEETFKAYKKFIV